ncbi:MAG: hypothetical protein ACC660_00135 [Acidimicrobiales bacterium]
MNADAFSSADPVTNMLFWFAGLSFVFVAWIFASPAIDYRLVMFGSVLPVVEMVAKGPWVLHSLLAPVCVMVLVMLLFRGNRLAQRKWLGVPIGMFMYLVLDGAWARTTLFWWPLFGSPDAGDIPTWEPVPVLILMEIVGVSALLWAVRRYELNEAEARHKFLRDGRLSRAAMGPPPGKC